MGEGNKGLSYHVPSLHSPLLEHIFRIIITVKCQERTNCNESFKVVLLESCLGHAFEFDWFAPTLTICLGEKKRSRLAHVPLYTLVLCIGREEGGVPVLLKANIFLPEWKSSDRLRHSKRRREEKEDFNLRPSFPLYLDSHPRPRRQTSHISIPRAKEPSSLITRLALKEPWRGPYLSLGFRRRNSLLGSTER